MNAPARFLAAGLFAAFACSGGLAAPAPAYKVPINAAGQPDLQGLWTNATITPLQRDAKYGDRLVITEADAKKIEVDNKAAVAEQNKPTNPKFTVEDLPKDCGGGFSGVNCGYNAGWVDPGTTLIDLGDGGRRTSIITSPKNGRMPPLTKEAQAHLMKAFQGMGGVPENPEGRALGERCLMSFDSSAGPPMLPLLYNNTYQIVQTKDEVTILVEMVHDVRHIRLAATHQPAVLNQWMGDSVGHWDGDTLVVETVNVRGEQGLFHGPGPSGKVVERFTRISPNQIKYGFTVDDPKMFTAAYSGEVALNATKGPMYEYACHEGNYALPGILAGARRAEKDAAEAKGGKGAAGGAP